MPVQTGMQTTFGANSYDLYVNIEDKIQKYPDPRLELLKRWDGKNFKKAVNSHEYRWDIRDFRPVSSTIATAIASGDTTLILNTPGVLQVNELFKKPSGEQCVVESVSGGVQVTFRTLAGTPEAVDIGGTVTRIGGAAPQGSRMHDGSARGKTPLFNYTSIITDYLTLSDTQEQALIRGDEGSDEQIVTMQKLKGEDLQAQLILGQRTADDTKETYTLGGLKYFIDTYASANVINFGGSGTWSTDAGVIGKLDDGFDKIAAKAFDKPVMYVGAKFMRKFKNVQDETTRTTLREGARGVGFVRTYLSHLFGDIDVIMIQDRAGIMDDLVFLVDESQVGYKAMRNRGWKVEKQGKSGDRHQWMMVGEYTAKFSVPESMVYLYNLGV